MTLYELGILMHYHVSPFDHHDLSTNPPAWRPTIDFLQREQLLQRTDGQHGVAYEITARGRVFIDAIQNLPLPEPSWHMRWPQ